MYTYLHEQKLMKNINLLKYNNCTYKYRSTKVRVNKFNLYSIYTVSQNIILLAKIISLFELYFDYIKN